MPLVEVIRGAKTSDETVVTDGQLRLVAGSRVSIKPPVGQEASK